MLDVNTYNYVESWHNLLKKGYFRKSRKPLADVLVHLVLSEILPDFKLKVGRIYLGLDRRKWNNPEIQQLDKCTALDPERAKKLFPLKLLVRVRMFIWKFSVKNLLHEKTKNI